jgi:hypothetical protein
MSDKLKVKIELSFQEIEERLESCPKLAHTDRKNELVKIDLLLADLDQDIQRFQMTAGARSQVVYEAFDEHFTSLTEKAKHFSTFETATSHNPVAESDVVNSGHHTQAQVMEGDSKLKEGKSRAQAMLSTMNHMREEINLIDDEIMVQREKLVKVNEQLKDTQSILKQSKRLIAFFSKAVYDDVFIKVMIGLIALTLIVIFVMCVNIKLKKSNLAAHKIANQNEILKNPNFNTIDEYRFVSPRNRAPQVNLANSGSALREAPRSPKKMKRHP